MEHEYSGIEPKWAWSDRYVGLLWKEEKCRTQKTVGNGTSQSSDYES